MPDSALTARRTASMPQRRSRTALPPHQPGGNRHTQVQHGPYRAENPVGRVPAWLHQCCVPVVDLRGHGRPADPGCGEADRQQNDQAEPRILRAVADISSPRALICRASAERYRIAEVLLVSRHPATCLADELRVSHQGFQLPMSRWHGQQAIAHIFSQQCDQLPSSSPWHYLLSGFCYLTNSYRLAVRSRRMPRNQVKRHERDCSLPVR